VNTNPYTITAETGYADGSRLVYRITQQGNNNVTNLAAGFRIPNSSTTPLPFSTVNGYSDIMGVMYSAAASKWDVISFIPGYAP